jgi:HPt (histidine-containing phosphotransfer) domain-containing protein
MTTPSGAPQPLGMTDFFALEAGEYLDRLDALMQAPTPPAADELVRLARALRGSALMANQQPIARAAMGFEALARALREGRRQWDAAVKQIATRAVDDLKIFVRKAGSWTADDTARAEALGSQLEQLGGRASGQVRAAEAMGLDAGARAFVAREGAAIASALDRSARALRANPMAHDPLQQVLKALQPLRGLAALNDLPPLPDLLEGIEQAIGELDRTSASPPPGGGDQVGELFQMAATAIAHAAREVAERGRPDPEGAEFRKFASLLVKFMESEPDVVPIDTIGTIVKRGTPSSRPATLGRLELVSHGEHLRQAADSLERAPSATQRELRAHTLGGTFRALGSAGGGPVAERVAEFAQAAREAVTSGVAVNQSALFAAELRKAGEILSDSGSGDEATTAAALALVTVAIRRIGGGTAAPAVEMPLPIVPIESLAPTPAAPTPALSTPADRARKSGASPAPAAALRTPAEPPIGAEASPDIAGSWARYQSMVAAGVGPASLDELIRGPSADTARPVAAPAAPAAPVVDIRALVYKGDRARQRAQELREAARRASGDDLRAIIDEVCDLVVLANDPE